MIKKSKKVKMNQTYQWSSQFLIKLIKNQLKREGDLRKLIKQNLSTIKI
jgi:hypothetical protein